MQLLDTANYPSFENKPASRCAECGSLDFHESSGSLACSECFPPTSPVERYTATAFGGRLRWRRTSAASDEPAATPDPDVPTARVYVSTSLDWFLTTTASLLDRDVTIGPGAEFCPEGVYRLLDRRYFAWLVARVESTGQRESAAPALWEIVTAAQFADVFGPWASDASLWPKTAPTSYSGPRPFSVSLPASWSKS